MMVVRDVMTSSPLTVGIDTPLKTAARIMVERGISGLVVVDDGGVVRGVLSEGDFLPKERGPRGRRDGTFARLLGWSREDRADQARVAATTAGEAMTSPAITIEADRPVADAAARLIGHDINRLPVMDNGRLVGIVTRSDLLRSFVVTDDQNARLVGSEVLARTMLLNPNQFEVAVIDGVVTIRGRVETWTMAQDVERLTWQVPGVVAVHAEVDWVRDDRRREQDPVEALRTPLR
jgi:CBS domain-containing protein